VKPLFQPQLVNGPFGDPALFVDFLFHRQALLFDLGDLQALPPRKILRLSHIFVSHTHMDHFIGFDRIVRVCLGRERHIDLFGPPGFVGQVEHRLASYTWNLVQRYPNDFTMVAHEVHADGTVRSARFSCRNAFHRAAEHRTALRGDVLVDEPSFLVRCATLDHRTPSLGFAIDEKRHVNIWKNQLAEMQLPTGPWLKTLKSAVLNNQPDDYPIRIPCAENREGHEIVLPLGLLRDRVLRIVSGQKLAFITDVVFHERNIERMVRLASNADQLFIEACFAAADDQLAADKHHLTTEQAGYIARRSSVKQVIPFHFSTRYSRHECDLYAEVQRSFHGQN